MISVPAGGIICWGGVYVWRHADALVRANPAVLYPRFSGLLSVIVGIGLTAYSAFTLNGDFVRERDVVAGVVTNKSVRGEMPFGKALFLDIDGRRFPTTAEVYAAVTPTSHVRATVGRGTGTVFTATN